MSIRGRRHHLTPAAALCLVPLLLLAVGCGGDEEETGLEVKIPVRVEEAGRGAIAEHLSTTGTVRAIREVKLDAPITGYLTLGRLGGTGRRLVEGDPVRQGQVIALLDSEETRVNKKSGIEARKAELQKAKADYERYARLYDEGIASEQELRSYESALATAQYNYDNTLIVEEQTRIEAPIGGRLTWLTREVDGAKVNAGEELAEVMDFSSVLADLERVLAQLAEARPGLAWRVFPSHVDGRPAMLPFEVARDAPIVTSLNRAYRALRGREQPTGPLGPPRFYGTDAAHFLHRAGMEGVVCGPGGKFNTMPDERVEIADYLDMIRIYKAVLLDICGHDS